MTEGYNLLLLLIVLLVSLGVTFSVYVFRGRRATFKVIEIFRLHNALGINNAKTVEELGLEKPDFVQRVMRGRDFRQYALQVLIKRGVVYETEDGRLYMLEHKLDQELREYSRRTRNGRL